jgi:hypothetical protein
VLGACVHIELLSANLGVFSIWCESGCLVKMQGTASSDIVPVVLLGGLGWICVLAFDQFLDISSCVVVSCLFEVGEVAYGSSIPPVAPRFRVDSMVFGVGSAVCCFFAFVGVCRGLGSSCFFFPTCLGFEFLRC